MAGVPRNMKLWLLGSQIISDVPKGCDVLVTIRLVKPDGETELLIEKPLFTLPLDSFVARVVPTDSDGNVLPGVLEPIAFWTHYTGHLTPPFLEDPRTLCGLALRGVDVSVQPHQTNVSEVVTCPECRAKLEAAG